MGSNYSSAVAVLAGRVHVPNWLPYRRITDVCQTLERLYRFPVLGIHRFYDRRVSHNRTAGGNFILNATHRLKFKLLALNYVGVKARAQFYVQRFIDEMNTTDSSETSSR